MRQAQALTFGVRSNINPIKYFKRTIDTEQKQNNAHTLLHKQVCFNSLLRNDIVFILITPLIKA